MDVLRVALLSLVASACYQPELESCAVACSESVGCPDDMVCGSASRCVWSADEACPAVTAAVEIIVSGKGVVADPASGIRCDRACLYRRPVGAELELIPEPGKKAEFIGWLEQPCDQFPDACSVTLEEPGLVATAAFEDEDD